MIELFEHNQIAYENARALLAVSNRAAIIHATGTGKSFIGLKFCEDNPEKKICWLSPSKYIYNTQLENIKKSSKRLATSKYSIFHICQVNDFQVMKLQTSTPI